MSLLNTIAHEGAAPTRGFSLKGIGIMAAGLALGVGLGFAIVNNGTAEDSSSKAVASANGLAHADFLRLNTTSYDGLVPAASVAATQAQAVDPFVEMNTTSYDGLVPAASVAATQASTVSEEFLNWNIGSLEYPAARHSKQAGGPR